MADKRVTDYTAPAGGPASGDKLFLVDVSNTTENANGSGSADTVNNIVGAVGLLKANNLSDLASAATARTNLGAQAAGATLDSLEGLSLVAGDILYATAADTLARLPKGTALQQLRVNSGATAPEWATVAAGGQTLYDRVVAASGGDHTTLAAAITASSAGDTIFVRSGTYSESAITSSLANLTIIGENPETTIISMGANTLTLSGARVRLQNMNLTASTGNFTLSGNYSEIQHCILSKTGNGQHLTLSGAYTAMRDSEFFDTSTGGVIQQAISLSGLHASIYNSYIECRIGLSGGQWLNCSGGYNKVFGTRFRTVNSAADGGLIATSGIHNQFVGNTIQDSDNVLKPVFLFTNNYAVIANNNINGYWQFVDATSASYAVITGNMVLTIYNAAQAVIAPRAIVCVGNRFSTTSGSGTQTGIALTTSSASHSIVSDNFLTGFATGISVGAGVTNATIHDNNLSGILTTPMTDAGTATNARNNVGASALHDMTTVRMKNTSGATITAGEVVTYKSVAAGDEVTTTTAAGDTKVYGVATAAITNTSYGYIQTLGKTTILKVNGTTDIAVGDYLSCFTTAGIAQKASAGQMAFAIALEAYTTDDSSGVLDALIITPRLI